MKNIRLELVSKPHQFAGLEEAWNALLTTSPLPFQTFGWNQSALRLFKNKLGKLHVYALREDDQITAILPGVVHRGEFRTLSDSYGVTGDIIAKQKKSAATLVDLVVKDARKLGLRMKMDYLAPESLLLQAFQRLHRNADQETEHYIIQNSQTISRIELHQNRNNFYIEPAPTDERTHLLNHIREALDAGSTKYEFVIQERAQISKNLLLEIDQFQQANGSKNSLFGNDDFIPFLNMLSQAPNVGLAISTVRDENRDLVAFDLGFRSGRNFYLLTHLANQQISSPEAILYMRHHQFEYLSRKGVKTFTFMGKTLDEISNQYPIERVASTTCISFANSKTQQLGYQTLKFRNEIFKRVKTQAPLVMIRLRVIAKNLTRKTIEYGEIAYEFFKDSTSRIKARLSSSTVAK